MKTCAHCGQPLDRKRLGGNYGKARYCGRACYVAGQRYDDYRALDVMWSKVKRDSPNGCWIYTGNVNNMGYGAMTWRANRMQAVHRLVYQLAYGNLPGPHVFCLHKCDTPRCCNPAHIFLGDDAANTADKVAKGRHPFGERAGKAAKLTEQDAITILRDYRYDQESNSSNVLELAARYGVSRGTVTNIIAGRAWKHLTVRNRASTSTNR